MLRQRDARVDHAYFRRGSMLALVALFISTKDFHHPHRNKNNNMNSNYVSVTNVVFSVNETLLCVC